MLKQELLEEIRQMPVIDTHEHFERYMETFGVTMPQFFYNCSCASVYANDLEKEDVRLLQRDDVPESEQFRALLRVKQRLRFTSCGRSMDRIAEKLQCELNEETCDALSKRFHERTKAQIRGQTPTIEGFICNSIGHPMYGGMRGLKRFLAHKMPADEAMHRVLNVTDLHCISSREKLEALEYVSGCTIGNLQDWEEACQRIIDGALELGIVGFKELYLYFRPMELGTATREQAQRELDKLRSGQIPDTALMDYMIYRVYERIAQTKLPVAVHTGALLHTAETAKGLSQYKNLICSFPEIKFDLLHLNYPALDEYLIVLRSCSNTYANAAWVTTGNRQYSLQFIRTVMDHIAAERVSFFGGDRCCAGEAVQVALEQTQDVLAEGLQQLIECGQLNRREALEIAALWMYKNPKDLYNL